MLTVYMSTEIEMADFDDGSLDHLFYELMHRIHEHREITKTGIITTFEGMLTVAISALKNTSDFSADGIEAVLSGLIQGDIRHVLRYYDGKSRPGSVGWDQEDEETYRRLRKMLLEDQSDQQ